MSNNMVTDASESSNGNPQSSSLRFHANAETDKALARAIATVPVQIRDTLRVLHIPPPAWVFLHFLRHDLAQCLQDALDGARKGRGGRGGAGRAIVFSADERRELRAEIRQLHSDAQLPKLPRRSPLILEARRITALQELYQYRQRIVRQTGGLNMDYESARALSTSLAGVGKPFSQPKGAAK